MASRDRTPADAKADKPGASRPTRRRIAGESATANLRSHQLGQAKAAPPAVNRGTTSSGERSTARASKESVGQLARASAETNNPVTTVARRNRPDHAEPKATAISPSDTSLRSKKTDSEHTSTLGRSGSQSRRFNIAGLVALLVFAIGVGVLVWGVTSRATPTFTESRDAAAAAAADGIETLFTFNYRTIEQHHEKAKALLTPQYAEEYEKSTEPSLNDTVDEARTVSTGEVREVGVQPCGTKCSADNVEVVVFFDIDSQGVRPQDRQVSQQRAVVSMALSADDGWKIDEVRAI